MSLVRAIVGYMCATALLALAAISLKWGFGHALLEPWYNQSSDAAAKAKFLEPGPTRTGIDEIRKAILLQDRADAHQLLGHFQLTAAYWESGSYEKLGNAKSAFESAIERRPSFVYSWAYLASVKYRMGEVDQRFFQALENSVLLGPWDPKVSGLVADYGLAVLDEVPERLQRQILGQFSRGAQQQGDLMIELAAKRGKLERVCALDLPFKIKTRCKELNSRQVDAVSVAE